MITGGEVKIDKDPDLTKLTEEARRLSMGPTSSNGIPKMDKKLTRVPSRPLNGLPSAGGSTSRRTSDSLDRRFSNSSSRRDSAASRRDSAASGRRDSAASGYGRRDSAASASSRRDSAASSYGRRDSAASSFGRRDSAASGISSRRGSAASASGHKDSSSNFDRRPSGFGSLSRKDSDLPDLDHHQLCESGLRRPSQSDSVLNDDPSGLMVGQQVWVDGTKSGRIAFIGNVHFAKGQLAGVHLDRPLGKNNGTVGGVMYFQCEPRHGIFSRLHKLAIVPL